LGRSATKKNIIGLRHEGLYIYIYIYTFCNHQWDPKDVRSFLTLLGSHKGLMMTLQGRNM